MSRTDAEDGLAAFLAGRGRLVFTPCAAPALSVLVSAAPGTAGPLLATLWALNAPGLDIEVPGIEVLVAGGTLDLQPVLARVDGVRVLPPALALEVAGASAVLLLQAGVCPRPGALDAALRALGMAGVGAVGGRLIGPGGIVRSAGGTHWSDGGLAAYGAGLPADDGAVGFVRDPAFVTAGFMALPRPLLLAAGGLDQAYDGAAYAGADLCARLRGRIVYAPEMAADQTSPDPPHSPADRVRFRASHPGGGAERGAGPAALLRARDTRPRRRLLVIDGFVPRQAMGAGYPRAQALLNAAVAMGWAVTLVPMDPADTGWGAARDELSAEIEVCGGVGAAGLAAFLQSRAGFYDTVLVSRPENLAALHRAIGAGRGALGGARLIYDSEALYSARLASQAALEDQPHSALAQAALLATELAPIRGVDAVAAVSEAEAAVLRAGLGQPVVMLSHPVRARPGPDFAARSGYLFIGRLLERTAPNWEGLRWFIDQVWPLVRAGLPAAELTVIGALHADHAALQAPGVCLEGPVARLGPAYDRARVFLAPTRFGAGVPLKVLEAAAAGLPVVTTRLIAGQLGWGGALAASDDPAGLAAHAVRLHTDEAAWRTMRSASLARVGAEHSECRFGYALAALLTGDAINARSGPGTESRPAAGIRGSAAPA